MKALYQKMPRQSIKIVSSLLGFFLLGLAAWFLYKELQTINLDRVLSELDKVPLTTFVYAGIVTIFGYSIIIGYDFFGLKHVRRSLSLSKILLTGFISTSFSNTVSIPLINVAGMRIRLYHVWGLRLREITEIIIFSGVGAWLGLLTLLGIFLLIAVPVIPIALSPFIIKTLGTLAVCAVFGYIFLSWSREDVGIKSWRIKLPSLSLALTQVIIGILDWLSQVVLFFILLPNQSFSLFWIVGSAFLLSMLISMISSHPAPAGLGVLDALVLIFLNGIVTSESLIVALILFRVIYHFVPFMLASLLFTGFEIQHQSKELLNSKEQ